MLRESTSERKRPKHGCYWCMLEHYLFSFFCYFTFYSLFITNVVVVWQLWNYGNVTTIESSENEIPSLSFDLISNNVLLQYENDIVFSCNSRGEQVRLLVDTHNDLNRSTFRMHVIRDKNFAIVYSRKPIDNSSKGIYISQGKLKPLPRFYVNAWLFLSLFMKFDLV